MNNRCKTTETEPHTKRVTTVNPTHPGTEKKNPHTHKKWRAQIPAPANTANLAKYCMSKHSFNYYCYYCHCIDNITKLKCSRAFR